MFNRMSAGASLGISTKISGNVVQTGAIASSNYSATEGSNFDLDGGTFKLGGSSSPKLSWNGTSLSVEGDITVTNPDTFATPATKNKADYNLILLSTGSAGTTTSTNTLGAISSLGYTGGNGGTHYYDNNTDSNGNTNPANIEGFDSIDYDLYVFDDRNWQVSGTEIQLALNLFDLGKSVLSVGNDTVASNTTGSFNTEWPIVSTAVGSGQWQRGNLATGSGIPTSHPILAGVTEFSTDTNTDNGNKITKLKRTPQGGTIVMPLGVSGSLQMTKTTSEFISGSGAVIGFFMTNPRGGRLVQLNNYGIGSLNSKLKENLTNFLLRTDPAIEAHFLKVTSITGEMVTTGRIESANYINGSGDFSTAGTRIDLDNGSIRSPKFEIDSSGNAKFAGDISAATGTFGGTVNVDGTNLTSSNTLNSNTSAADVGLNNVLDQAQTTTFRQPGVPTATAAGDIWIDTNDGNKMYVATTAGNNQVTASQWVLSNVNATGIGLGNVDNDSTSTIRTTAAATAGAIAGWKISSYNINSGTTANTSSTLSGYLPANGGIVMNKNGSLHSPNFFIDSDGTAAFKGTVTIGSSTLTEANTLNENAPSLEIFAFSGNTLIPTSTNKAGGTDFTFTAAVAGAATLKLVISDAEATGEYTGEELIPSTNLTQFVSTTGWTAANGASRSSGITDPTGNNAAYNIKSTASNHYHASSGITATAGKVYEASVWMRGGGGTLNQGTVNFMIQELGSDYSTYANKVVTLTDNWTKYEISGSVDTSNIRVVFDRSSSNFNADVYLPSIKKAPNYSGIQGTVNGKQLRKKLSRFDVGANDGDNGTYFENIEVIAGTNEITLHSTNGDGGYVREIQVLYIGTEDTTSGTVGGWVIENQAIYSGVRNTGGGFNAEPGITLAATGSIHSKGFYIDHTGSANFKGLVQGSAITGSIIAGTSLIGSTVEGGTVIGGSINVPNATNPNFSVDAQGQMTASDASITGDITATSGRIGDWVIDAATNALRDDNSEIVFEPNIPELQMFSGADKKVTISPLTELTSVDGGGTTETRTIDAVNTTGGNWSSLTSNASVSFVAYQGVNEVTRSVASESAGSTFNATTAGSFKITLNIPSFTVKKPSTSVTGTVSAPSYNAVYTGQTHGKFDLRQPYHEAKLYLCAFNSSNANIGETLLGTSTAYGNVSSYSSYVASVNSNASSGGGGYSGGSGSPWAFLQNFQSVDIDSSLKLADGSEILAKDLTTEHEIKAWDEINQKFTNVKPHNVTQSTTDEHFEIEVDGNIIKVSPSHKFWTDGNEEINIQEINPGYSKVYVDIGSGIELKLVTKRELIREELKVVSPEVPPYVNYIANNIVHHNTVSSYTWSSTTNSAITGAVTSHTGANGQVKNITLSESGTIYFKYKWVIRAISGRNHTTNAAGSTTYTDSTFTTAASQSDTFTTLGSYDTSIDIAIESNFVEIKAGGIQVVSNPERYVRINRVDASTNITKMFGSSGATPIFKVTGSFAETDTIIPSADNDVNLGDFNRRWKVIYGVTGNFSGNITAYASSDERLKDNIVTLDGSLNKVLELRGTKFDWIKGNEEVHPYEGSDIGFVAQEVKEILPEVVGEMKGGYYGLKYEKLTPILVEAIKELSAKVDKLEKKLESKN